MTWRNGCGPGAWCWKPQPKFGTPICDLEHLLSLAELGLAGGGGVLVGRIWWGWEGLFGASNNNGEGVGEDTTVVQCQNFCAPTFKSRLFPNERASELLCFGAVWLGCLRCPAYPASPLFSFPLSHQTQPPPPLRPTTPREAGSPTMGRSWGLGCTSWPRAASRRGTPSAPSAPRTLRCRRAFRFRVGPGRRRGLLRCPSMVCRVKGLCSSYGPVDGGPLLSS